MTNFFNINFGFPFIGMNNWFMPNFTFTNFFMPYQIPYFNMFNYNSFNIGFVPQLSPSLFFESLSKPYQATINSGTENKKTEKKYSVCVPCGDSFELTSADVKNKNYNLDGYNSFKGKRLANIALNNSVGWTGYCATYVKKSIQDANLGFYQNGHAYKMPKILRNNPNFKEISTEGIDVSKLPAGCILVYGKGVEGYSKDYGHTEITTGDGRGVSDGITENLYKKPSNIFIPV